MRDSLRSAGLAALDFLNLLERNKARLSLTNAAVLVIIVKLAWLQTFTLTEVGAFVVAMLGYAHKRHEANKAAKTENTSKTETVLTEVKNLTSSIEERLSSLETKAAFARKAVQ